MPFLLQVVWKKAPQAIFLVLGWMDTLYVLRVVGQAPQTRFFSIPSWLRLLSIWRNQVRLITKFICVFWSEPQIFTYLRTLQSSDRNEDFLRVKEDEAKEQHKSIIEALKAAAPEWTFEQINFVTGRCGVVVEDDFYNTLDKLNVQAGNKYKILMAHVQRICEAHDTVMRSYYQQIHGSSGADATMSMENIGEQVYV